MVEYRLVYGGKIEVHTDKNNFVVTEFKLKFEEVYDYCIGLILYLENRDDEKAKQLFIKYYQNIINNISNNKVSAK